MSTPATPSASSKRDRRTVTAEIRTVAGPIPAGEAGRTLVHEHIWSDFTSMLRVHGADGGDCHLDSCRAAGEARWNPSAFPENYRLDDLDQQVEEVASCGVTTVVDATPPALGRNPAMLLAVAEATGLNIVMGCGWYIEPTHDDATAAKSTDELASGLIDEIENGVDGVYPGIIGEIGTSDPPTDREWVTLRAAAIAAVETGLALSIHLHPWGHHGAAVIDAVSDAGLAPDRVLLNHVTTLVGYDDELRDLLDRGVGVAFDLFGFDHSLLGPGRYAPSDHDAVDQIARLVDAGYIDQLFVSQDVGVRTRLLRYGGWGYGHLVDHILPLMASRGIDDSAISTMIERNPQRLLAVGRKPG